jgi:hypothetical protein
MFRASLAHPQEALRKWHLIYYVRIMCCATSAVSLQSWHSQLTLYARNIQSALFAAPLEDEQVMFETCTGRPLILHKLNERCITLFSLY